MKGESIFIIWKFQHRKSFNAIKMGKYIKISYQLTVYFLEVLNSFPKVAIAKWWCQSYIAIFLAIKSLMPNDLSALSAKADYPGWLWFFTENGPKLYSIYDYLFLKLRPFLLCALNKHRIFQKTNLKAFYTEW